MDNKPFVFLCTEWYEIIIIEELICQFVNEGSVNRKVEPKVLVWFTLAILIRISELVNFSTSTNYIIFK